MHTHTMHNNKLALCVTNLTKSYDKNVKVLKGVSMSVEEGIVYGLIGSSGSGKTTILSCILNVLTWDTGEIHVFGERLMKGRDGEYRKNIGNMPQELALHERLKVKEAIAYYGSLLGLSDEEFRRSARVLMELLNLSAFTDRYIHTLSGGQKRRISLTVSLIHKPKLLILDEPTVGLDALLRENVWNYLYGLSKNEKTTILITTHYIEELKNSNKVGIMRKGRIVAEEDPKILMEMENVGILENAVLAICHRQEKQKPTGNQFGPVSNHENMVELGQPDPIKLSSFFRKRESFDLVKDEWGEFETIRRNKCSDRSLSLRRSLKRSLAYSKVVLFNYFRDIVFIGCIFGLPTFQLITTGLIIGSEPKETKFGMVNNELIEWEKECPSADIRALNKAQNPCDLILLSCQYFTYIEKNNYIDLIQFTSEQEAIDAAAYGKIRGYLVVPANYSEFIVRRAAAALFASNETIDGTTIPIRLDMGDYIKVLLGLWRLVNSFRFFIQDVLQSCHLVLPVDDVYMKQEKTVYGDPDESIGTYVMPAFVFGAIFEIAMFIAPHIVLAEIQTKTLQRSKVAGLGFMEFTLGLIIMMLIITVLQSALYLAVVKFILNFHSNGHFLVYLLLCWIAVICGSLLGLLIGLYLQDEMGMIFALIFMIMEVMLHIGMFRPEQTLSSGYHFFVRYFIPSVALAKSFRWVMIQGVGLLHPQVWPGVVITLCWSLILILLIVIVARKVNI